MCAYVLNVCAVYCPLSWHVSVHVALLKAAGLDEQQLFLNWYIVVLYYVQLVLSTISPIELTQLRKPCLKFGTSR